MIRCPSAARAGSRCARSTLRASRSSGPGGQHANVTASRIEASFDVAASDALTEEQKRADRRASGPRVVAVAQDARSQTRNRELALERLRRRLTAALAVQRPRPATDAEPRAAKQRRLEAKRRQAERKRTASPRRRASSTEAAAYPEAMRWLVDGMNVIGTRPDGWWRDRDAAMLRLVDLLERWAAARART